ncbi:MAG: hypothetical protein KF855_02825 [Acidobacteria bacterium]|nr:hypothetical protein [Acidobacteriota bacterium]
MRFYLPGFFRAESIELMKRSEFPVFSGPFTNMDHYASGKERIVDLLIPVNERRVV